MTTFHRTLAAGCLLSLAATGAHATPVTFLKDDMARVYAQQSDQGFWESYIGANPPFGTSKVVVDRVGTTLDLKLYTNFLGSNFTDGDCFGSTCAYAADIALSSNGGATYDYGISLGKHGVATGLYAMGANGWSTSRDIWGGRSGFYYGGGWAECSVASQCGAVHLSDTVIKSAGNTLLAASPVTVTLTASYIDVSVANFTNPGAFSLFWGTADCSNDPITAQIAAVPEPRSLGLLAGGLFGLGALRRRKRGA